MSFEVRRTTEFDRVAALPRQLISFEQAERLAADLTPVYAKNGNVRLRPSQGAALTVIRENNGGWLALPVGEGKTLLSFLAPTVLHARRPLLIMKGKALAKAKTPHDFAALAMNWEPPPHPHLIKTLEWLSTESADGFLERYDPDCLILEESDDMSSLRNGAVKRIDHFVVNKRQRGDNLAVVAMTATPIRKSLMGVWHLFAWCLDEQSPLPLDQSEARMWALCVDLHTGRRPSPGPLGATVNQARAWVRQRILEAPGVLVMDGDSCKAPLTVRTRLARECSRTNEQFERFLLKQETPGGEPISDPLMRFLLDGQLGLGLYSYWDPPPPDEWLSARREFAGFCRRVIEASQHWSRPLFTERQVMRKHQQNPVVVEWLRLRHTFDDAANRHTAWFSRAGLDSCHDWLRGLDAPGIVFCGSVEFGQWLAREAKLAYYGPEGQTSSGGSIVHAPEGRSFVASWQANKKGLNLQAWSRLLIVMPPQSAKWLEQIVGRAHRQNQFSHVIVDILATSGGSLDLLEKAFQEADFARTMISLTQKVLRAEIIRATPTVTPANEFRWARAKRDN